MKFAVRFTLFSLSALCLQAQVDCSLKVGAAAMPVSAGEKLMAELTVNIDSDWHIASITQLDGGPVRTEIALAKGQHFKLAGPIIGPKPKVEHSEAFGTNVETHEGTVTFTIPLEATKDVPSGTGLAVDFTYQACSGETCAFPTTQRLTTVISEPTKPQTRALERASNRSSKTNVLNTHSAVHWGQLDNGIRYTVLANPEPKGRASLHFVVTASSLHEIDDQWGLRHFLERLVLNGSTHFAPGTLVEYLQRLGMRFGGDTNTIHATWT